ncbi:DUF4394 domain-containing protein [Hansschlegelia quercus]|uniref:DUF4394 domain-containing protein n=1 Tax=Hansschlegelia quercus TaxID=2528245 RepID=A0A4Q9GH53_9HYPH|nr:DUF4394 domain-containing protein [Hansschlegelia quercus]TBN47913.1 DUF4394 domain-containing protein [Hansschlegelia quercus]
MNATTRPTLRALTAAGALGVATLGLAASAKADSLLALAGGKSLHMIDPGTLKVTDKVEVSGASDLVGIDVRPMDGMLYGVTASGDIVTIDARTGAATKKSALSEKLPMGAKVTVDFNPMADRLRIMTDGGMSLRVNVDDGKATVDGSHKYAETDMHKGETPNVVAGAYTNSLNGKKAEKTELFNIDATIPALVKQAPPNDGVLSAIGKIGMKPSGSVAFEIAAAADGSNAAWLLTSGALYSVDLKTGATTKTGEISGLADVIDIAWWPSAS